MGHTPGHGKAHSESEAASAASSDAPAAFRNSTAKTAAAPHSGRLLGDTPQNRLKTTEAEEEAAEAEAATIPR